MLHLFIRKVIKMIVVIIDEYHCYKLHIKFYPVLFFKINSVRTFNYVELLE